MSSQPDQDDGQSTAQADHIVVPETVRDFHMSPATDPNSAEDDAPTGRPEHAEFRIGSDILEAPYLGMWTNPLWKSMSH